jgi:hypothetical protein
MSLQVILLSNSELAFMFVFVSSFALVIIATIAFIIWSRVKKRELIRNNNLFELLNMVKDKKDVVRILNKFTDLPADIYNYPYYNQRKLITALPDSILGNRINILISFLVNANSGIRSLAATELVRIKWSPANPHEQTAFSIATNDFANPQLKELDLQVYLQSSLIKKTFVNTGLQLMSGYYQQEKHYNRIRSELLKFLQINNVRISNDQISGADIIMKTFYSVEKSHNYVIKGTNTPCGSGFTQCYIITASPQPGSGSIDEESIYIRPPSEYTSLSSSHKEIWGDDLPDSQIHSAAQSLLSAIMAFKCRKLKWFYDKEDPPPEIKKESLTNNLHENSSVSPVIEMDDPTKEEIRNMFMEQAYQHVSEKYSVSIKEAKRIVREIKGEDKK